MLENQERMSSGLTVSRLGVQASVVGDLVHGLICLRVSLLTPPQSLLRS